MASACSLDAAEYVSSVMETPSVTPVQNSPEPQNEKGRKRNLSEGDAVQDDIVAAKIVKKPRGKQKDDRENDGDDDDRTGTELKSNGTRTVETPDVGAALRMIHDELQSIYQCLTERMDTMEKNLEKKISAKLTQIVDKRVNAESDKLRKDVDRRFTTLREDINNDLENLAGKVEKLEEVVKPDRQSEDRSLNVAIMNLHESVNENLNNKVNGLIKDGLKVRDVTVVKSVRKTSRSDSKPGVIIATFRTATDKAVIMKAKSRLKASRNYGKVFIQHDQSKEERVMASNFRALVEVVRQGHGNVRFQGSRVLAGGRNSDQRRVDRDRYNDNSGIRDMPRQPRQNRDGAENGQNRDNSDNGERRTAREEGRHSGHYTRSGGWRQNNN